MNVEPTPGAGPSHPEAIGASSPRRLEEAALQAANASAAAGERSFVAALEAIMAKHDLGPGARRGEELGGPTSGHPRT